MRKTTLSIITLGVAVLGVSALAISPMNFGTNTGPMNGDEPSVTYQKILAAVIGQPGSGNVASAQITVGTTPTSIPARFGRRSLMVRNIDPTNIVYEGGDATVSSSTGYELLPGESLPLNTQAAVFVVSGSGTPKVAYTETFN